MSSDKRPTIKLWKSSEESIAKLASERGLSVSRLVNIIVAQYLAETKWSTFDAFGGVSNDETTTEDSEG